MGPRGADRRGPERGDARLAKAGWINVTEGNVTDYRAVREALVADADRFVIESVALDYAFQGIQLAQELMDEGIAVTRCRSGCRAFAEPMVQFERRVVEGSGTTAGTRSSDGWWTTSPSSATLSV